MEVHKHPHHVMHKKKWSEYLLEFFMLFLAVFLGFVAENIRENIAERHKEKEYMKSMVEDLKADAASFTRTNDFCNLLIKGEDSILNQLSGNLQNRDTAELAMIYFFKYGVWDFAATMTDRTITQLKNSGGMRFIRDEKVSDDIVNYYNHETSMKDQSDAGAALLGSNYKEANAIFNIRANRNLFDSITLSSAFNPFSQSYVQAAQHLLTRNGPTLLTEDPKTIATFMANIESHRGLMAGYAQMLLFQRKRATELIQFIKEQYHLTTE